MKKMVAVKAATLRKLLKRVDDAAHATYSRYDRKAKKYPWSDALYREADPYEYGLVAELRAALRDQAGRS